MCATASTAAPSNIRKVRRRSSSRTEESKDRKYRFVVKRLMANQRQGDEPPGLQILCGDADDFKKVQAQVDVVSPVGVCADDGDGGGDDEGDGGGGGRGRNKGGVVAVVVAIDG